MKSIILILFSLSFFTADDYILTAGIGTNKLVVGKTKVKVAIADLGKNYQIFKHGEVLQGRKEVDGEYYINSGDESIWFDVRYTYEKKGIALLLRVEADQNDNPKINENTVIEHIIFEGSAHARTSNNIVLNVSTVDEILAMYGQWESSNTEKSISKEKQVLHHKNDTTSRYFIHYRLEGISFGINSKTHKVSLIDIYPEEGRPYFR